jgi:hypothetical protein
MALKNFLKEQFSHFSFLFHPFPFRVFFCFFGVTWKSIWNSFKNAFARNDQFKGLLFAGRKYTRLRVKFIVELFVLFPSSCFIFSSFWGWFSGKGFSCLAGLKVRHLKFSPMELFHRPTKKASTTFKCQPFMLPKTRPRSGFRLKVISSHSIVIALVGTNCLGIFSGFFISAPQMRSNLLPGNFSRAFRWKLYRA